MAWYYIWGELKKYIPWGRAVTIIKSVLLERIGCYLGFPQKSHRTLELLLPVENREVTVKLQPLYS